MRLLQITDTHFGAHMNVLGAPGDWHRGDDHARAVHRALRPVLEGEVDLVVHTGDVFDRSKPTARAMQDAARLLKLAADHVPVVLLPGNHDRMGLQKSLPLDHPNLHIHDRPTRIVVKGMALGLVPFFRHASVWEGAAREVCRPGVDLLLTHMAFDGAQVPGFTFRADQRSDTIGVAQLPEGVHTILCGHIHPRQVTELGGVQVLQPGATERTGFTEADQTKGVLRLDWERRLRWRFEDLPTRPMRTLRQSRQIRTIEPGWLVRNLTGRPDEELLRRGAWVITKRKRKPPEPPRQVGLFG